MSEEIENEEVQSEEVQEATKEVAERPEWLLDKYQTETDQAKAYPELYKKFGGFTGAPKEGYTPPEGLEADDPLFTAFSEYGKEFGMSQEALNKGFEILQAQSLAAEEVDVEERAKAELEKLGDKADERIGVVKQFLTNNLSESDYKEVESLITSAQGVMLVEKLIPATKYPSLPSGDQGGSDTLTEERINELAFKKNEHGQFLRSVDPKYDQYIMDLRAKQVASKA